MSATPIDELRMSLDATGHLVAGVRAEQWSQPTPCTGWTVRQLVNHLVAGNRLFAGILSGQPMPPPEQREQSADQLGDDPGTAYRASASDLVAAFGRPGVLQQKFTVPVGQVPGIAALHLRVVEAIVHGWDLAHATSQPVRYPDQLIEQEIAFTRSQLADLPAAPAGRGPFGPSQPVAEDAPPLDRLAGLLGRTMPVAG